MAKQLISGKAVLVDPYERVTLEEFTERLRKVAATLPDREDLKINVEVYREYEYEYSGELVLKWEHFESDQEEATRLAREAFKKAARFANREAEERNLYEKLKAKYG